MGTSLILRVRAGDSASAWRGSEAAISAVERVERALSTWRAETPLSRLRADTAGHLVPLDEWTVALLREAQALTDVTGGAFDPTVGPLIDVWHLRGAGRRPAPSELREALARVGWRHYALHSTGVSRDVRAAWIDTGAFGKGAAMRAAVEALRDAGCTGALMNFGGQVLVVGRTGEPPHMLAVADPARRDRIAARIAVTAGSLATTGQSERSVLVDGDRIGHVLDPRTGRPVPAWGSVSVLDADPVRADALSTALFVLGPDAGPEWAERHGVAALFLVRGADTTTVRATSALADALKEE